MLFEGRQLARPCSTFAQPIKTKTLLIVHLRWAVGDYDVHANGRARPCLGAGAARTGVAESTEEEE